MSDKPKSGKTQLEALEAHLLEKRLAKSKPATKPPPVLTKQSFNIQVELNQPLIQKDFLSQLPEEIAHRIIVYLTPCDLTTCAGVSRTWQRLCEDNRTWRRKCLETGYVELDAPSFRFLGGWAANRANEQAGITIFSHMDLREAHQNRREREIAYGQCYERSSWKSLYLRKQRIISNWRSRPIQSSTVLKWDDKRWISSLQIHSGRIVTGNDTLWVWNVGDAQRAFALTGQIVLVWMSQMSDDGKYIVGLLQYFGCSTASVCVWCGQTGVQRHVLQGHMDFLLCIRLHGTTLVSGSNDQTLRVWDIVDGKCLHILAACIAHLVSHQRAEVGKSYFRMQLRGSILISSYGSDIKVWDIRDGGSCTHRLQGANRCTSIITSLQLLDSGLLVTGSENGLVKLWDVDKGTFVRDLVCLQSRGSNSEIWHLKATETLLAFAVVSLDQTEDTKFILIDFDASYP